MRLGTIRIDGGTRAVRIDGDTATPLGFADVGALLGADRKWASHDYAGVADPVDVATVDWAPLIPNPEKIFCVGLNYGGHAAEAGLPVPAYPMVFAKYSRSLIGANDDLVIPSNSDKVDWEAELAVVMGDYVRHASERQALEAIAGYTVLNDISMRDWQTRTPQFLQGKTFEASTPLGPTLVTPDEVDHARRLRIQCSVDGEVVQDSFTDDLIFSVAFIVSYLSQIITLVPGDVIATGTPAGVGAARTPARFLTPGQTLRTEIEGLGVAINHCVAPGASSSALS